MRIRSINPLSPIARGPTPRRAHQAATIRQQKDRSLTPVTLIPLILRRIALRRVAKDLRPLALWHVPKGPPLRSAALRRVPKGVRLGLAPAQVGAQRLGETRVAVGLALGCGGVAAGFAGGTHVDPERRLESGLNLNVLPRRSMACSGPAHYGMLRPRCEAHIAQG
jgi:hypothetical protein